MRIKYEVLDKLKSLTNKEMDLFVHIARHQSLSGIVYGLHHKDACTSCNMSKQSFYNALYALSNKGIITYKKQSDIDYDVTIIDNNFDGPNGFKQGGYINLHKKFVKGKKFKKLKANEKYLLFSFIKVAYKPGRAYTVELENFYKSFASQLGIMVRTLRYYLQSLKEFFKVLRVKGCYRIVAKECLLDPEDETSDDIEYKNFVNSMCRRYKLHKDEESIYETAKLIKQYRGTCKSLGLDIYYILRKCISYSTVLHTELKYKYIHQLVRSELKM